MDGIIDNTIGKVGAAVHAAFLSWFSVDWFWLHFTGHALVVLAIIIFLGWLTRFLPDAAKPYLLAIATLGIGYLWGKLTEYLRQRKAKAAAPKPAPKPAPPKRNDSGWKW